MATSNSADGNEYELPEVSVPEVKVLKFLAAHGNDRKPVPEEDITIEGLGERDISSAVSWLEKKKLIEVKRQEHLLYDLTPEGHRFLDLGLPEERAYAFIKKDGKLTATALLSLMGDKDGRIAMAQLARLGIKPTNGELSVSGQDRLVEIFKERREFLDSVSRGNPLDQKNLEHFRRREDVISERKRYTRLLTMTDLGKAVSKKGGEEETLSEITTELLQSGSWKGKTFRRYDLNAPVERIYSSTLHPITFLIDKVRRIFLDMGFTEMDGHYVEYSGWNMDALFIPQDHPARDMQDTFYLDSDNAIPFEDQEVMKIFKKTHEKGIPGYSGWGYSWDEKKARELLLRTHTTVSTIRYLYHNNKTPQAAFSVEKVFRHESVDWKHLAELHQIEGTYYGKDANLATLIWLMKEFYSRLGFKDLKFVPSYYPYTEPSLDVVAIVNGKEMELGGSGVFRPEVTKPLGLNEPVVAWGLGLERLAMIYYGFEDIRDIYQSDIDWLRTFTLKY